MYFEVANLRLGTETCRISVKIVDFAIELW